MRRTVIPLAVVLAAAAACAPATEGPGDPAELDALELNDVAAAAQARAVALEFLQAYARSPTDDGRSLQRLMEGLRAEQWAHWLAVQHDAFPGTLEGSLQLGYLGPARPVRLEDGSLDDLVAYAVLVRATIAFEVTDPQGDPLAPFQRVTDGVIVLVRSPDGAFRVLSFDRDGLRLDQFFQVFEGASDRRDGVRVAVRTLLHSDQWQFGLEITNGTRRPLRILPDLTTLLADGTEPATDRRPLTTFSRPIPPGATVEGLLTFAAPEQTTDLDLRIAFEDTGGETTGFVFGLPTPPSADGPGTEANSGPSVG
jgi:hypothetical protein